MSRFSAIFEYIRKSLLIPVGRDSSVGIGTLYGLDGPGIESRWGRDFSHAPRPALGPTQPPIQWVKRQGRGVDSPPPSSAEVKERVELYLYSPYGPSWLVLGRTLPFTYTRKTRAYEQFLFNNLEIRETHGKRVVRKTELFCHPLSLAFEAFLVQVHVSKLCSTYTQKRM